MSKKIKSNKNLKNAFTILENIQYQTLSFFGFLYRSVRYKTTYFLDTNFIITSDEKNDSRYLKLITLNKNFYTTDYFKKEIDTNLKKPTIKLRTKKEPKLNIITFNDLYNRFPGVCPTYYNFLASMNNPANVASPNFPIQFIFSKILKNKTLTKEEITANMRFMGKLDAEAKKDTDKEGKPRTEFEQVLYDAQVTSIKKRKDGLKGKNENYANDIRSLALIFSYALFHKRNVVFLTADADAITYFFDWSETLIQQVTFNMKCLEKLGEKEGEGMGNLVAKRKIAMFFNSKDLFNFIRGTLARFYSNRTKYLSPRLSIKYWDKKRQKYFEVGVNISEDTRQLFIYSHGSLNCPTAKNDIMGSFIAYRYWWPPNSIHDFRTFKILPICKSIYKNSQYMPPKIHDTACKYRRDDLSNNIKAFSSFT